MKKVILAFLVYFAISCCKDDSSNSDETINQNIKREINPTQTDVNYNATEKNHYIVRNNTTHKNKLLLFIGGSYSTPNEYNLVCDYAATIGLDVISLSYPNDVATAPLGSSSNQLIFDNYRNEICFGNQVSDVVNVTTLNCINTRTIKLIEYLKTNYPNENWGQYLTATNTLQWDKIIVSGHSQGSGHACYLAKINLVNRVVMFAGPNDYSTFFNAPANWLTISGLTPINKHFSLLHTQDEIVPFNNQVENLKGLGLLNANESHTLADNLTYKYLNKNALSLNISAISYHSSPIGGNNKLPNIWKYMFIGE